MAIKSVLCPYSGELNSPAALDRAIRVARRHDAWLTGVVARGPAFLEKKFRNYMGADALRKLREEDEKRVAEIGERFTNMVSEAGISEKTEFVEFEDNDSQKLAAVARGYEIIIVGRHSEDLSDVHLSPHPDLLAMQSGRAVLVVPEDCETFGPATNILVAWDGKRSAARAVSEAMVLLENEPKVTLLTIGADAQESVDGLGGIRTMLARRGVEADHLHRSSGRFGVGKEILSVSKEIHADLLVMGAYEHSKFSHDLFGGPTTDVIAESRVPVLLAH